jgi:hypothetical protein
MATNSANSATTIRVVICTLVALALVLGALVWREYHTSDRAPRSPQTATQSPAQQSPSAPAPTTDPVTSSGQPAPTIALRSANSSVHPHQTVRLTGRISEGARGVRLRVQQLVGARWIDFPLPVLTNAGGRFTAFVELSHSGRIILRVLRPDTGVPSNVVVVLVDSVESVS